MSAIDHRYDIDTASEALAEWDIERLDVDATPSATWSSPPAALTELPSATGWRLASCLASSGRRSASS
jgi:hypothetical protein